MMARALPGVARLGLAGAGLYGVVDGAMHVNKAGGRPRGYAESALGGAAMGAAIGSIIPGLGTALGAAVGAAGGLAVAGITDWWSEQEPPKLKAPEVPKPPKMDQAAANATQGMTPQQSQRYQQMVNQQNQKAAAQQPKAEQANATGKPPVDLSDIFNQKSLQLQTESLKRLTAIDESTRKQVQLLTEESAQTRAQLDRIARLLEAGNNNTKHIKGLA
jgi:hypothetical protein